jgi:hypothetical protein
VQTKPEIMALEKYLLVGGMSNGWYGCTVEYARFQTESRNFRQQPSFNSRFHLTSTRQAGPVLAGS